VVCAWFQTDGVSGLAGLFQVMNLLLCKKGESAGEHRHTEVEVREYDSMITMQQV
jgi:hypothetical protein